MHANVRNNEIIDFNSKYLDEDITRVETTQEMYELYRKDTRAVIYQDGDIVENPDYVNIELAEAKQSKIEENDRLRDEKLSEGVEYSNVLFDSDTDQKINLLASIGLLNDGDNIVWFGMDNEPLLCYKQDLLNIGNLITQLHTYCWTHNSEIKQQIANAKSIEELDNIKIEYKLGSDINEYLDNE